MTPTVADSPPPFLGRALTSGARASVRGSRAGWICFGSEGSRRGPVARGPRVPEGTPLSRSPEVDMAADAYGVPMTLSSPTLILAIAGSSRGSNYRNARVGGGPMRPLSCTEATRGQTSRRYRYLCSGFSGPDFCMVFATLDGIENATRKERSTSGSSRSPRYVRTRCDWNVPVRSVVEVESGKGTR